MTARFLQSESAKVNLSDYDIHTFVLCLSTLTPVFFSNRSASAPVGSDRVPAEFDTINKRDPGYALRSSSNRSYKMIRHARSIVFM